MSIAEKIHFCPYFRMIRRFLIFPSAGIYIYMYVHIGLYIDI
nr:MAG TPA: hypothetical protein [Caudoviricetes sp.]